jgi:hypothetical protein
MTIVERRSQCDSECLSRALRGSHVEIIREALVRRGQSQENADEIVGTCLREFREGDPGLLEHFREKSLN